MWSRAPFVALALVLTACGDTAPTSAGGFQVGMSQDQAFEVACERTVLGTLNTGPILYVGTERRPVSRGESICDIREAALASDTWWIVEAGLRERYVVLTFVADRVTRIELKWRGWDP